MYSIISSSHFQGVSFLLDWGAGSPGSTYVVILSFLWEVHSSASELFTIMTMYRSSLRVTSLLQYSSKSRNNLNSAWLFRRGKRSETAYGYSNPIMAYVVGVSGGILATVLGTVAYTSKYWSLNDNAVLSEGMHQKDTNHETNKKSKTQYHISNCLLTKAIEESTDLVQRTKDEVGSPGLAICVSVDGEEIWSSGLGYADLENRVPCKAETVMRIASISKSITMAIIAKLWQGGKLDLDKPINQYIISFPQKEFNGKKVDITTRQLVSHLGGIRHYTLNCVDDDSKTAQKEKNKGGNKASNTGYDTQVPSKEKKGENEKKKKSEFLLEEYHIRDHYNTVTEALKIFQNDALCSKPGTEFYYTTHGWSLVSAVAEGASGKGFPILLKNLFKDVGLEYTYLDQNDAIIYNRARYYIKDDRGRIINAPYIDCSYKWAGGGILSTVQDLNKFGNAMLYSYQQSDRESDNQTIDSPSDKPGYLNPKTAKAIWTPVQNTKCSWDSDGSYGMGWGVIPGCDKHGACRDQRFYVSHTGGAIGASSVLLVLPRKQTSSFHRGRDYPRGVVVSIIVNLQSVGLNKVALEIAKKFEKLQ